MILSYANDVEKRLHKLERERNCVHERLIKSKEKHENDSPDTTKYTSFQSQIKTVRV